MKKLWTAIIGISLMLVISVSIFVIAHSLTKGPGPSQQAGNAGNGSPAEVPEQTLPQATVQSPEQLRNKGKIPLLQRDVTPDEVTQSFEVGTEERIPGFTQTLLQAKRGDVISIHFTNNSLPSLNYRDSFVLTKPGKSGHVILEANRVGLQQDFIPKTDDVLAASRLIGPGETDTILFRAPDQPGDYPFISTYPGHGLAMRGILRIE